MECSLYQFCFVNKMKVNEPMARPIKDTPHLTGKDTKRFFERMDSVKLLPAEEIGLIKKIANKFVFVLD